MMWKMCSIIKGSEEDIYDRNEGAVTKKGCYYSHKHKHDEALILIVNVIVAAISSQ